MTLFLKLILGHLIGDYLFQTKKSVTLKQEKKLASPVLYIHAILHGLVTWILLWSNEYWAGILFIVITHFIIDAIKLSFQTQETQRAFFFTDQLLHIVMIVLVWFYYLGHTFSFAWIASDVFLLTVTCILFLTQPASIVIKIIISKWAPDPGNESSDSLAQAGKYIGIIERLFVFGFIVAGRWEAIGFLIAAKSVFRFSSIKDAKDRKLTEYILIGTLISFGLAMLTGYLFLLLR